jgi:hypothetical protein
MAKARAASTKSLYEDFARFAEQPTRERLRGLLQHNVGELAHLDFKEAWPEHSKLARHILGLANTGGGVIVIGVAEADQALSPVGVTKLIDKTDILKGVQKYIPHSLHKDLHVLDFSYNASEYGALKGKTFQVLIVEPDIHRQPFLSLADAKDIRANAVYVRRNAATEEATHEELQNLLNVRLETGYSTRGEIDLQTHLRQLETLYDQINPRIGGGVLSLEMQAKLAAIGTINSKPNPLYPKESFDAFIVRMIEKKKIRIELELDLGGRD